MQVGREQTCLPVLLSPCEVPAVSQGPGWSCAGSRDVEQTLRDSAVPPAPAPSPPAGFSVTLLSHLGGGKSPQLCAGPVTLPAQGQLPPEAP